MDFDWARYGVAIVGAFGAGCALIGTLVTQLLGMRKSVMQMLVDRVAHLELESTAERLRCDQRLGEQEARFERKFAAQDERLARYRHALRNADARFAAWLQLSGMSPEKVEQLARVFEPPASEAAAEEGKPEVVA